MKTLLVTLTLLASIAQAQEPNPAVPPSPCAAPEYRHFGFWVGHWDVTQNGKPAGTNHIQWIDGGCAMLETWTSAAGNFSGHSLNFYDKTTGHWHQTWVDSSGTVLNLKGGLENGPEIAENAFLQTMVLQGAPPAADGKTAQQRISWTPNPDGTVRQHWEQSPDGKTWSTLFDGLYQRR